MSARSVPRPGVIGDYLRYIAEYMCDRPEADCSWLLIDANDNAGLMRMAKALGCEAVFTRENTFRSDINPVILLYRRVKELEAQ